MRCITSATFVIFTVGPASLRGRHSRGWGQQSACRSSCSGPCIAAVAAHGCQVHQAVQALTSCCPLEIFPCRPQQRCQGEPTGCDLISQHKHCPKSAASLQQSCRSKLDAVGLRNVLRPRCMLFSRNQTACHHIKWSPPLSPKTSNHRLMEGACCRPETMLRA